MDRPVLLIDDSPDIREAFEVLMELEGFKVVTLESARLGLEYLTTPGNKPLIIILDLTMPEMDGHGFLEKRNADGIALDIPVIVFSAHHQTAILPGTVGWAKKPIDIDNLIKLIRKHT
jgi:DNA-binding NtrC family response regulator